MKLFSIAGRAFVAAGHWACRAAVMAVVCGWALAEDTPPTQSAAGRPNVLFIAIDDLNDWVGKLGGHRHTLTPNFDRLCAQGVYFTNAHCNVPICAASRNSLLSGLRPTTTGWYANEMDFIRRQWQAVLADTVPLPQHFRHNGYDVRGAGKIYHGGTADYAAKQLWSATLPPHPWPPGFHDVPWRYSPNFGPMPPDGGGIFQKLGRTGHALCWAALGPNDIPGGEMPDERVARWAVDQLAETYDRPFFLAVGFVRPHVPYTAPARYFERFDRQSLDVPDVPVDELADVPPYGLAMAHDQMIPQGDHAAVLAVSDTYWRELVHGYLACVAFVDEQVGRVLDALDASPHAGNTIVVLWSDHGQHLGEKKSWRKMTLWEEATRVPLVFRLPGSQQVDRPCARPVSLIDIYPTLIELCDLPDISALEGVSLKPLLENPERPWDRPVVTTWHYQNHSVRSQRWRYTRYRDGGEELYDHDHDPAERVNRASDPRFAKVVAEHRRWLPDRERLPYGQTDYRGDKYDELVRRWQRHGGPPDWLLPGRVQIDSR